MKENHNIVTVPQRAWWGDIELKLDFPEHWDVHECRMTGHNAPKLTQEGFRKAFADPIGCRPIRTQATGKKNVVILFDDMSRPTKAAEIVPFVLDELEAAGVQEEDIQFICSPGSHGPLSAYDFAKKLGKDVIFRFNVYNHNMYENCTYIGTTSRGTPVNLNTEYVNADFKIAIGALLPHINVGFGGGGKIVLPGVASIESIIHNHGPVRNNAAKTGVDSNTGLGRYECNAQLLDTEEACKMSGLNIKIDAIVNINRDTTALFVGDPIAQYYEAVKLAKDHYHSSRVENPDIVIANCYAKGNETVIGTYVGQSLLPESGGTLVMITDNPAGEVCHFLRRSFGNHIGGRYWNPPSLPKKIEKFVLLMPHKNKASVDWFAPPEQVTWTEKWEEVRNILADDYPDGARVAVIPDATMQYFEGIERTPFVGRGAQEIEKS
jgi:nickel-dependent lactate racemase